MMLSFPKLREIMERKDKLVTSEELEMLKKWLETNEGLMKFKEENGVVEDKDEVNQFGDFQMDIYDIIKHNDPNFRSLLP